MHLPFFLINASILAGGSISLLYLFRYIGYLKMTRSVTDKRLKKQEQNMESKIAFEAYLDKNPMPKEEIEKIVTIQFTKLVSLLRNKELSYQQVMLAYQHKAFQVDKFCNCIIDFVNVDFSEINLNGPLAGVPVSLKDNISIKGYESHAGLSVCLNGPALVDSLPAQLIKNLGGVPFVRTIVPQSMLSVLSSNPIDGVCCHPKALDRCPCGSSSGEGALIGGGGSILGFGTDFGGSIRLPAAVCGIVGFKPTTGRLSSKGMFSMGPRLFIESVWGPLTRDVETCVEMMRLLFNSHIQRDEDPKLVPLDFNENLFAKSSPLRIGYFVYNGSYVPVPAAQRAVLHCKARLESQGHELVPWQPPVTGEEWLSVYLQSVFPDGGTNLNKLVSHDIKDLAVKRTLFYANLSNVSRIFERLRLYLKGDQESKLWLNASLGLQDFSKIIQHIKTLNLLRQKIFTSWTQAGLDAVISPVAGFAAPLPLSPSRSFTGMLSYSNLINILGCPAGSLPSGYTVDQERDLRPLELAAEAMASGRNGNNLKPRDTPNADGIYLAEGDVYPIHTGWHRSMPDLQLNTAGYSVAIQVFALPWRDEICLRVMQELNTHN